MASAEDLSVKVRLDDPAGVLAADPRNQRVAPGAESSEYERTVSGGWWGSFILVAGALVASSSTLVELITGLDAKAGQIAGVAFTLLGVIYKAAVERAYISGRAAVKVATANGASAIAVAEATPAAVVPVVPMPVPQTGGTRHGTE